MSIDNETLAYVRKLLNIINSMNIIMEEISMGCSDVSKRVIRAQYDHTGKPEDMIQDLHAELQVLENKE